ncbi:aldehyde dehydrogenase family protein [Pseudochelatococcus contaminans]|uniref:aldehyde dehydrogenase (NAD(+)) n=1 Tax=Pseudochelatococcus contaminans TaxID=1538103 RepID=A0A7W5Z318_9HYPH|nr:aldehyde dehydrogenase family protein [Pseudochelatococcus contaminans]MBB3809172.1 aldehyde dehydrogenase (NAD+) [Pseudochelatococcus contaminans]
MGVVSNGHNLKFFIDGAWVDPVVPRTLDVIDPATEEPFAAIAVGAAADVDKAVAAAKAAFATFSTTSREERLALLRRILAAYNERAEDLAQAVSREMGAPITLARKSQVASGQGHLEATIEALENFTFEEQRGTTRILREPIGVAGLITPWNWPLNQIVCKVAPAIAAGCTVVLKPSEVAPLNAIIFAEVIEAAGVPAGVFNLVNGTGEDVGQVISGHPDVDFVSFTGSTRAGVIVARTAADTVKRVAQELGGKSANIVLPDADFEVAIKKGVLGCYGNSGQSCNAPTRLLVPADRHEEALEIARKVVESVTVGDPRDENTTHGPVVSAVQFDKIQKLIEAGISEGATLVAGGPGRPEGLSRGYYVRPTVFGNVTNDMAIAREEIFGPVLTILPYKDEDEAIRITNDTVYGLAGYVQSQDIEHARKVARRIRAGAIYLNYPEWDTHAPFGGYKQSGNGREYADWGIHDFLEIKGVPGWG